MMNSSLTLSKRTQWLVIITILFSLFFFSADFAYAQQDGGIGGPIGSVGGGAQSSPPSVSIDDLESKAASYSTDSSRSILWGLLGDFAENPLTASATPTSLLGQIFFIFNVSLFVIGVAFMGYTVVMSIAVSAHEGEVMGRRMSSLWVPIRYGFGVLGMIPAFGGFSLAQGVMMFFAILGIGLANIMTQTAVESVQNFDNLIGAPSLLKEGPTPHSALSPELGQALFAMNVCASAVGDYHIILGITGKSEVNVTPKGAVVSGSSFNCGAIDIVDETGWTDGVIRLGADGIEEVITDGVSYLKGKTGFRNSAVDYQAIAKIAKAGADQKQPTLLALNNRIKTLANDWYLSYSGVGEGGDLFPYPMDKINEAVFEELEIHDQKIKDRYDAANLSTLKVGIKQKMIAGGWTGIGSWFSLFSEVGAAIQSAGMSSRYEVRPPNINKLDIDDGTRNMLLTLYAQEQVANDRNTCWGYIDKNATGNCSPAQNLFKKGLAVIIEDTGGEGMVNPIIAAKNIGDWMLTFVASVAGSAVLVHFLEKKDEKGELTGEMGGGTVGKAAKQITEGMSGSLASLLLTMSLILGLTFAVYIPFVPFLTWFSGLVSYFSSVLEGLVAAQVWAFSHLQTEGEGMGQKAERGYLFILNMLLRPALMVLGFFFASGLLTLLGTFFFNQFGTALANVQGNTITGPFIMIGLIIIIGLALLTLIQTVFNLIYEIPDRVISWFGGGMEARMAKEMDSGIERGAKTAAQWTGGTALGTALAGAGRGGK